MMISPEDVDVLNALAALQTANAEALAQLRPSADPLIAPAQDSEAGQAVMSAIKSCGETAEAITNFMAVCAPKAASV